MAIRKTPKQARSQHRVDAILDAAAELFEEGGYEGASTNEIAARAGVPIGSLYQFFTNKEAILSALVERFAVSVGWVCQRLLTEERVRTLPLYQVIGELVDGMATFQAQKAGFHTLFVTIGASAQFAAATASLHEEIVSQVDSLMALKFIGLKPERRRLCAVVCVALVKAGMALPGAPDHLPQQDALTEVKAALLAYMRDFLAREGLPTLPDLTPP